MGIEKAFYYVRNAKKRQGEKDSATGQKKMFLGLNPPKSRAKFFSFLGNNGAQYYAGNSQESVSSSRKKSPQKNR